MKTFWCIFRDAVNVSDYIVLKIRIFGKYELGRIWKETVIWPCSETVPDFAGRTEGNNKMSQ
jgi:hypothetical protein